MTSFLPLPDWMPWWAHLAILLAILFFGLMFLLLPFSVFGTKSRLEGIEARLDEIQGELRSLALRMPELPFRDAEEEVRLRPRNVLRPPIPPSISPPVPPPPSQVARREAERGGRTEPRLY